MVTMSNKVKLPNGETVDLDTLSDEKKLELLSILKQRQQQQEYEEHYCKFFQWEPYDFHIKALASFQDVECTEQTALMCANRIGKTYGGGRIVTSLATGLEVPKKFFKTEQQYENYINTLNWFRNQKKQLEFWVCGEKFKSIRFSTQKELIGPLSDPGSGAIPKEYILHVQKRPSSACAESVDYVLVKRVNQHGEEVGTTMLTFKAYEEGNDGYMGGTIDFIWLDEEPPCYIYTQCVTRTATTLGKVLLTFTPEGGVTETVQKFLPENIKPGMTLIQATWWDAPHLTEKVIEQMLEQFAPHEKAMRSRGVPFFGSGLVYPVDLNDVVISSHELPSNWQQYKRIGGIDFAHGQGFTAWCCLIVDDDDNVWMVDEYKMNNRQIVEHATEISVRLDTEVAWPHDGGKDCGGAGRSFAETYIDHGVTLLDTSFTNPTTDGKRCIQVEPGVAALYEHMRSGKFKILDSCTEIVSELQKYHREKDTGQIAKRQDDHLCDALRYAFQMRKHSEVPHTKRRPSTSLSHKSYYTSNEII